MLTNDNASMDSRSTMACLLIGQPSLRRQVKLGMFAAYVARPTMSRNVSQWLSCGKDASG